MATKSSNVFLASVTDFLATSTKALRDQAGLKKSRNKLSDAGD